MGIFFVRSLGCPWNKERVEELKNALIKIGFITNQNFNEGNGIVVSFFYTKNSGLEPEAIVQLLSENNNFHVIYQKD